MCELCRKHGPQVDLSSHPVLDDLIKRGVDNASDLLRQQKTELEEIIKLKDRRIAELEKLLANKQTVISIPSVWQAEPKEVVEVLIE